MSISFSAECHRTLRAAPRGPGLSRRDEAFCESTSTSPRSAALQELQSAAQCLQSVETPTAEAVVERPDRDPEPQGGRVPVPARQAQGLERGLALARVLVERRRRRGGRRGQAARPPRGSARRRARRPRARSRCAARGRCPASRAARAASSASARELRDRHAVPRREARDEVPREERDVARGARAAAARAMGTTARRK